MTPTHALITGLAPLCPPAAASADALQIRGLAASSSACHGMQGVAPPGMESLAGQSRQDLLRKLLDFKSGSTPARLMHPLSKGYSEALLAQLAGYFAALTRSTL